MKKIFWIAPILLLAACSVEEPAVVESNFYYPEEVTASIDDYSSKPETKVYLDESLKVLWTNDDRISLFNKYTYNKEYRFSGRTGTNSGVFKEVSSGEVIVGNELDYVYAVYPYDELTEISNSGVITLDLPSEQAYAENSFGLGANTMVSATTNTELLFKNLCGYVVLKLYGDGVSVSSITFMGNNGEVLAGTADITAAVGSTPTLSFQTTGTSTSITLNCATPVELGATAEDATVFWLVVPPMTFSKGFTITVTDPEGNTFEKSTSSSKEVVRNRPFRMGALMVEYDTPLTNNTIYYTHSYPDEIIITPDPRSDFGANIVSNTFESGQGILTFDGDVTSIGQYAFSTHSKLTSISIPESVTSIGQYAFHLCQELTSISLPENVSIIEQDAFSSSGLTSINIPKNVTDISPRTFDCCFFLTSISLPDGITNVGEYAFNRCKRLTSINIPEGVTTIGDFAFMECDALSSVIIPKSITRLGGYAFDCLNLSSIYCYPNNPPEISASTFNSTNQCPIYVPAESLEAYKTADYWSEYADRIQAIPEQ